jgi:hypothetical protein
MTNGENPYDQTPLVPRVESPVLSGFMRTMTLLREWQTSAREGQPSRDELPTPWNSGQKSSSNRRTPRRLNLDHEKTKNGLAQLVLTVVKLLHELIEKQALHRIDGGGLTDEEIERLGFTLMRQSEEIAKISREFGLDDDDLNLDLGPLGKLL